MELKSYNSILITGGTRSFGKEFLDRIIYDYPEMERVVIYIRDVLKKWQLKQKYPEDSIPPILDYLGISEKELLSIIDSHRTLSIWAKESSGWINKLSVNLK